MKSKILEDFRPKSHYNPVGFKSAVFYYLRLLVDFQMLTIHRSMLDFLKNKSGRLLDVGCGNSPFRSMIEAQDIDYVGIDIETSENFDYLNRNIHHFDGQNIPFEDDSFDLVICTEVLEHVEKFEELVDEMKRVLKPGGQGFVTIPWSARFHYIPYDFQRLTPTKLKIVFEGFNKALVSHRGTDISVIINKLIVVFARSILPRRLSRIILYPFVLLSTPILFLAIIVGHVSIKWNIGSQNDPLGYTIQLTK